MGIPKQFDDTYFLANLSWFMKIYHFLNIYNKVIAV